jgi:hypothetical protein
MKPSVIVLAALAAGFLGSGCGGIGVLDNYDAPESTLSGQLVFQGAPVGLKSNEVQLELWQPGYQLNQKIPVYVAQDGSFSAKLFDGNYKLNVLPGSGPFVDIRDTIPVQLNGKATVEVPVTPYYTVANQAITNNAGTIQATVNVGSVNTTRNLEFVGVYVFTTNFVDRQYYSVRTERARSTIPNLGDPVTVSVALTPALAGRDYVFARVGVKTVGITPLLYGPIVKITL